MCLPFTRACKGCRAISPVRRPEANVARDRPRYAFVRAFFLAVCFVDDQRRRGQLVEASGRRRSFLPLTVRDATSRSRILYERTAETGGGRERTWGRGSELAG